MSAVESEFEETHPVSAKDRFKKAGLKVQNIRRATTLQSLVPEDIEDNLDYKDVAVVSSGGSSKNKAIPTTSASAKVVFGRNDNYNDGVVIDDDRVTSASEGKRTG